MGFNITSWGKRGKDWGRGEPPPKGSIEYIAVGSMWTPDPPRPRQRPDRTDDTGFSVYEISFTELDAADRWVQAINRSVEYARKIHGDKILSAGDAYTWQEFMSRWKPFKFDMALTTVEMMLKSNKVTFNKLMNESKKLHDGFVSKGMAQIPVPYAAELVSLLRTMPKRVTAEQMYGKLAAGIRCGDKMLDESAPWWAWKKSGDTKALHTAVENAKGMGAILRRSRAAKETYAVGDPVYDEFLRRLAAIWIEAAGLYGIEETKKTAKAETKDDIRTRAGDTPSNILLLLLTAGVGYLGIRWVTRGSGDNALPQVAVPDAYVDDGQPDDGQHAQENKDEIP